MDAQPTEPPRRPSACVFLNKQKEKEREKKRKRLLPKGKPRSILGACRAVLVKPRPAGSLQKHQSRTREMQGALQLRATVSPPPVRRPGDRPVPSAPLQAAVAAHEALGALRPQHRSREDLSGPDQVCQAATEMKVPSLGAGAGASWGGPSRGSC